MRKLEFIARNLENAEPDPEERYRQLKKVLDGVQETCEEDARKGISQ